MTQERSCETCNYGNEANCVPDVFNPYDDCISIKHKYWQPKQLTSQERLFTEEDMVEFGISVSFACGNKIDRDEAKKLLQEYIDKLKIK